MEEGYRIIFLFSSNTYLNLKKKIIPPLLITLKFCKVHALKWKSVGKCFNLSERATEEQERGGEGEVQESNQNLIYVKHLVYAVMARARANDMLRF